MNFSQKLDAILENLNTGTSLKIYLDLDDVLADTIPHLNQLISNIKLHKSGHQYDYPRCILMAALAGLDINASNAVSKITNRLTEIYTNLPLKSGAMQVINAAKSKGSVTILTSIPDNMNTSDIPGFLKAIEAGKTAWGQRHGLPVICVGHGKKGKYADPSSVLVDDSERNIQDFMKRGKGILYKDAAKAVNDISLL